MRSSLQNQRNLKTRNNFILQSTIVTKYVKQEDRKLIPIVIFNAQKLKFSIKDFFSKCNQISRRLRIWSHLLKKPLINKFIFWAVLYDHLTLFSSCVLYFYCNFLSSYQEMAAVLFNFQMWFSFRVPKPNNYFIFQWQYSKAKNYSQPSSLLANTKWFLPLYIYDS